MVRLDPAVGASVHALGVAYGALRALLGDFVAAGVLVDFAEAVDVRRLGEGDRMRLGKRMIECGCLLAGGDERVAVVRTSYR